MNRGGNRAGVACIAVFLAIGLASIFSLGPVSIVRGLENGNVQLETKFDFLELTSNEGQDINASDVFLSLPSSSWNMTGIELNFTDIRMGKQEKVIEDQGSSFLFISKSYEGLGVEINVTQPIDLLGVEIYGYILGEYLSDVSVQVMGLDNATNAPNTTIYGNPVSLNMSSTPGWHLQSFPSPISLVPGSYFLVLDGSTYLPSDNSQVLWFNNESNPLHPNLHVSELDKGSWSNGEKNKTLRHKLIQRLDQQYNPEDINMTVELGSENYSVANGSLPYSGILLIPSVNHAVNEENVTLQIHVNNSVELLFNAGWEVQLARNATSAGTLMVYNDGKIQWQLDPEICLEGNDYSLVFYKPSSWQDYTITRNGTNITAEVNFHDDNYTIPSTSISSNSMLRIVAYSTKTDFDVNVPYETYRPNQEILCTAVSPLVGNLTFILLNDAGIREYNDTRTGATGEEIFSKVVDETAVAGPRYIYVIWNNETDAGAFMTTIEIEVPFTMDPVTVVVIVMVTISSVLGAMAGYQGFRLFRKRRAQHRQNVIKKAKDLMNLNYLIVMEKRKGLDVYEHYFGGKELDSTLITGFLEAIASFGIELTSSGRKTQTIKLEYQEMQILMSEYKNFRLTWIMKEPPSEAFLNAIDALAHDIEEKYGASFRDFNGETTEFEGIGELLEKHFNISFIVPLTIKEAGERNLNLYEKRILEKAKQLMEKNGTRFFYTSLLFDNGDFNAKDLKSIFQLIQKGIFKPM